MSNRSEETRPSRQIPADLVEMTDDAIPVQRPEGLSDQVWHDLKGEIRGSIDSIAAGVTRRDILNEIRAMRSAVDDLTSRAAGVTLPRMKISQWLLLAGACMAVLGPGGVVARR
jgi:hypothetical protein